MKAIITGVKKSSGFHYLNGLTFEVKQLLNSGVALKIPSKIIEGRYDTCDFSFSEITIVDISLEIQNEYEDYKRGGAFELHSRYYKLFAYCTAKGIVPSLIK